MRGGGRVVAKTTYDERHIPKQAGFRWDPDAKVWWTDDMRKALKLRNYANPEVAKVLDDYVARQQAALEASRATDAAIDLPRPDGLDYLPFQRAGIAWALDREAALIADEMGLGKTIQAIGLINADPSIRSACIVCPLLVKLNWRNELKKWMVRDLRIGLATAKEWPDDADIVIVHPNVLWKWREQIRGRTWDLLAIDEAHLFKNPHAQRTVALFGGKTSTGERMKGSVAARRRLCLSGTPIPNRPVEMYPILHWLDPKTWSNWEAYVTRYCGGYRGRYGWDVSGATNLKELQQQLRSTIMIRRLKADVLTELPAKRRQIVTIDPDDLENGTAVLAREQDELADLEAKRMLAELSVETAKDDEAYKAAVAELRSVVDAEFAAISKLRHSTALAKVPAVVEHVTELLEHAGKITVWAHHHDVIDALVDGLKDFGVVVITGDTPPEERETAVQRFQNDSDVRVFVGSITAAGVGITLTAASVAVFAELDWVPGNVSQAEDRCHRIGQHDSVLVQHIVLDESIDAKLAQTLVAKQEIAESALDRKAGEYSLPEAIPVQVITSSTTSSSKKSSSQKEVEQFPEISEAEIDELRDQMRFLAAADMDWAAVRNGVGFSRIDGSIGHVLAEATEWTPKMAAIAKKLAHKYRRQLAQMPPRETVAEEEEDAPVEIAPRITLS